MIMFFGRGEGEINSTWHITLIKRSEIITRYTKTQYIKYNNYNEDFVILKEMLR